MNPHEEFVRDRYVPKDPLARKCWNIGLCVDCRTTHATVAVPAIHSFNDQGKPNGSKEMVCDSCSEKRKC